MPFSNGVSPIIKVLIPAGVMLAMGLGGASWRVSLSNEHRLTAMEDRAEDVLTLAGRTASVENTLTSLVGEIAALRGATEERNRNEALRVGDENARLQNERARSLAEATRQYHERVRDANENQREGIGVAPKHRK